MGKKTQSIELMLQDVPPILRRYSKDHTEQMRDPQDLCRVKPQSWLWKRNPYERYFNDCEDEVPCGTTYQPGVYAPISTVACYHIAKAFNVMS